MNAVDTNVFVYYSDSTEPVKQAKAAALLQGPGTATPSTILLWQVLAEFANQMRSWHDKGRITWPELLNHVNAVRGFFPIETPSSSVLDSALVLAARYSLSHWDSMILGACDESGVTTHYTEDMGAPIVYSGIQLMNPFQ